MVGLESIAASFAAAESVGWVLLEAIVLYVGYGALTKAVGPFFKNALAGE
jgi:hypothetical protein